MCINAWSIHPLLLQGLSVSTTTGHVTWNPALSSPGDYSVQLIVEDIFTRTRVCIRSDVIIDVWRGQGI